MTMQSTKSSKLPLVLGTLLAGMATFVFIRSLPEIRRYLRMRRM